MPPRGSDQRTAQQNFPPRPAGFFCSDGAIARIPELIGCARPLRRPPQQLRKLGDVGRHPPRFVAREQLGGRAPAGFVLQIDVGESLAVALLKQSMAALSQCNGGPCRSNSSMNCGRRSEASTSTTSYAQRSAIPARPAQWPVHDGRSAAWTPEALEND
jgi:hypothetical protein